MCIDPQIIQNRTTEAGLTVLGELEATDAGDGLPQGCVALLLIGWGGAAQWGAFSGSPEYADGKPDPLDRWTRRVVDGLAADLNAEPLYPFGGPPWLPFQRWALAAGIGHKSPIGLLIHPTFGLWCSFRAALAFKKPVVLPPRSLAPSPCDTCIDRPCLTTCPIGAYTSDCFAYENCRAHVRSDAGTICRDGGCLARAACPVGRKNRYLPDQIAFHQRAFIGAGPA